MEKSFSSWPCMWNLPSSRWHVECFWYQKTIELTTSFLQFLHPYQWNVALGLGGKPPFFFKQNISVASKIAENIYFSYNMVISCQMSWKLRRCQDWCIVKWWWSMPRSNEYGNLMVIEQHARICDDWDARTRLSRPKHWKPFTDGAKESQINGLNEWVEKSVSLKWNESLLLVVLLTVQCKNAVCSEVYDQKRFIVM